MYPWTCELYNAYILSMVVQHIVFIKYKPGTTEDQIKELSENLKSLSSLGGVVSIMLSYIYS